MERECFEGDVTVTSAFFVADGIVRKSLSNCISFSIFYFDEVPLMFWKGSKLYHHSVYKSVVR